jgi:hypothetical protein
MLYKRTRSDCINIYKYLIKHKYFLLDTFLVLDLLYRLKIEKRNKLLLSSLLVAFFFYFEGEKLKWLTKHQKKNETRFSSFSTF